MSAGGVTFIRGQLWRFDQSQGPKRLGASSRPGKCVLSVRCMWYPHLYRRGEDLFMEDTLIVAGDVAEKLETFATTMTLLKDRFKHVFFVPGNHDLWCRDIEEGNNMHSLEKLWKILEICCSLGVEMQPKVVKGVGIVPLFSWYHQSFDKEPDIPGYRFPPLKFVCRDFQACKWQFPNSTLGDTLAVYFDNMNSQSWNALEKMKRSAHQVISFSHFLPRLELCPEKRMLFYPNLPKVVGSDYLEASVRRVHGIEGSLSACHVFGHTHFCWDATLDGIRYIQAPLAYPNERLRRINGGGDWLPFCLFNSDNGGLVDGPLPFYWSQYYHTNKRDPSNNQLAPWVFSLVMGM
ncbi:hypothetical protein GOP47_0012805 [Adiantum capillus-veneris]|uniref:Calcineurin-like phosphoesterase domain-containing protein n=1 Tax=Adiantum capillus-veneris TaxID=13818 RepID=A0A9D4ZER5_ADICA|nr:hypothetical protein GOP47_0012805 [Adiantum capillus-veneris]